MNCIGKHILFRKTQQIFTNTKLNMLTLTCLEIPLVHAKIYGLPCNRWAPIKDKMMEYIIHTSEM